jgi:2-polyprenyl-3-methyl-5-hydroxy-6-metoxy-1,4-benzoquinol methylase
MHGDISTVSQYKDSIHDEFAEAVAEPEEYRKQLWGSETTWLNRFENLHHLIAWDSLNSWADVGCGTAKFFELAGSKWGYGDALGCHGFDASSGHIELARKKDWTSFKTTPIFEVSLLESLEGKSEQFDLVTAVGVIYGCGMPPEQAIRILASRVRPGGQLIITTENLDFTQLQTQAGYVYPSASELREYLGSAAPDAQVELYLGKTLSPAVVPLESVRDSSEFKEIYSKTTFCGE